MLVCLRQGSLSSARRTPQHATKHPAKLTGKNLAPSSHLTRVSSLTSKGFSKWCLLTELHAETPRVFVTAPLGQGCPGAGHYPRNRLIQLVPTFPAQVRYRAWQSYSNAKATQEKEVADLRKQSGLSRYSRVQGHCSVLFGLCQLRTEPKA